MSSSLNPVIDFQILETKDPKVLMVADNSNWGAIENEPSIIEITPPNKETFVTYYFGKHKVNSFNSSLLNLSESGELCDLPDGIYRITVKGSPSTKYCVHKDYLKTDKLTIDLYSLMASLGDHCDEISLDKREELVEQFLILKTAEAKALTGEPYKAGKLLECVRDYLDDVLACEECKTC